jgi:hydrogenase 3 maturation protease
MTHLKTRLTKVLQRAERIAVLAVGSRLRGDDAAGLLAADELAKAVKSAKQRGRLAIFLGETAPENLTGPIRQFNPTHLIVIDAADMGQRPGSIAIIEPGATGANASFCTHALPINILTDYLRDSTGCRATIIGIQPATREFGREPSSSVRSAAIQLSALIAAAVQANEARGPAS